MHSSYKHILVETIGRAAGDVTLHGADGSVFTSSDYDALAAAAAEMDDPWVDLVTSEKLAIGLYVPGNADVVTPEPAVALADGMVFMLDGDPLPDQQQGIHLCPLAALDSPNDLVYHLPEDLIVQTPSSPFELKLSQGRRRDEKQGQWKLTGSTFGQFADYLQVHQTGQKDGPCFLQGEAAGGSRKAMAMVANYILGVDLDSGAPLSDVMDTIVKHGLEAVIYTTHSHLKATSVIKRDHFFKWSGGTEIDEETVRDYLVQVKGTLPAIVEDLTIVEAAQHTEDGIVILVSHKPMPKFRAVFPLSEPFVFALRGGSQQDAINEWKERYAGFCSTLGLFFDEKCVDPARLFYFPRHAKGSAVHGAWHIVGDALDIEKFDRVKMKRGRNGKRVAVSSNVFTAAGGDEDEDDENRYVTECGYDLRRWAAKHAKRFEIHTLYDNLLPDEVREPRGSGKPGTHIACPFEAEHTNFGGGGTFVVNASDGLDEGYEAGFVVNCTHNACAGRDRLDFLKVLIDDQLIEVGDITDKQHLLALEDDEEDEDDQPRRPTGTDIQPARIDRGRSASPQPMAALVDRDPITADDDDWKDDEKSVLRAFNRRYAVIVTSGGVKILKEPSNDVEDDDVQFLTQNDVALLERTRNFYRQEGNSTKKVEGFKAWLEWEHRRTYSGVVFAPGRQTSPRIYNLFRGWGTSPVEGDWSLLRDHIYENICDSDDALFGWFMTWLAHLFQQPENKPGSTVVITGEKGTGKSTLFDYINKLLGRCGITVSQRKQIVGQFNGHLATTLLMVCEEAFWAADPQAEGVLKDMITNKSMLIEKKGYDPIQSSNYTRLALISNNDWVVPASLKDERRFFVLRCSNARQGDVEFFGRVRHQMEHEGGLEAMMHELMTWQPYKGSWGILYTPPITKHLQTQQIETLSGVQKFMLELIKSGVYETLEDKVPPISLDEDKETIINAVEMRAAIEDYVRYRFASDKAKTSFDDISVVIQDWFGAREARVKMEGRTNMSRMFVFPPLSIARANLKEKKGLDIVAMPVEEVRSLIAR